MPPDYVPDERIVGAPPVPGDRPPTREEVWAYVRHWFHDLKDEQAQVDFARGIWVDTYVRWVIQEQWRRPPDWTDGAGHQPEPDPNRFEPGNGPHNYREMLRLKKGSG